MKQIIRNEMKNKRNNLSKFEVKEKSKRIFENLFQIKFTDYDNYFVYKSFGNEVETDLIISHLFDLGKQVFIPKIIGNLMKSVEITAKSTFKENNYGILESEEDIMIDIDKFVAIMPCLAVDKTGNRIGFGGGFYDKFLENKNSLKIAICYDFQVIDKIVPEEFDIPVDIIVTEKRIIICDLKTKKYIENNR